MKIKLTKSRFASCALSLLAATTLQGDDAWRELPTAGAKPLLLGIAVLDDGVCLAVGGGREDDPAIILRSEDAGESWKAIDAGVRGRLYAVHFPTPAVGYAVGLQGNVLKTADAGRTWTRQESGTKVWLATVFFLDAERGFAAGSDRLLATRDGGETWTARKDGLPELPPAAALRDLCFVNASLGLLVGDDGLALRTADGGATWAVCETGSRTWLRAIACVDTELAYVAGAQGELLVTRDAGATWEIRPHPGQKLNDVFFLDATEGFTTTMEGDLHHTEDGGRTWTVAYRGAPGSRGALTAISRPSAAGQFVVGEHGTVLHRALD